MKLKHPTAFHRTADTLSPLPPTKLAAASQYKKNIKYYLPILFILFLTVDTSVQNTILWKITPPNSGKVSYLLGTFHQIGNSFVDSIPILEKSLLKSDVIIFESIDSTQMLIKQMNERECTNEIADLLKKRKLQMLRDISEDWRVNICKLTPQEVYVKLNQERPRILCNSVQPTDTAYHFDNYLQRIAKINHKEIVGLESLSFQSKTINQVNASSSNSQIRKRIKRLLNQLYSKKPDAELCALIDNYRNFKIDYNFDEQCPEGVTLKGRNENWMKILPDLLKQNNCFIAVGLAHLMMKCGLIESLKDEGFIIEPIILDDRE